MHGNFFWYDLARPWIREKKKMSKIIYNPSIEFDDFKLINELVFSEYYYSLFRFSVDVTKPKQKTFIEGRSHTCAFCNKNWSEETKFSNDAHVIPAFLNDPKLLSIEECDNCNHKFGEEYESDLSKMLNPLLIASQILPRKGLSRKAKNKETRVEYNKENGIDLRTTENFTVNTEEGSLSVSIPREVFNPQKALRSLLHTFWLVIDSETRKDLPWITDALENQQKEIPTAIYFGYNISGGKEVSLELFKRIKSESRICDYILKLEFGLFFLYYGIYNGNFKPILIEPIAIDESIPIPPSLQMTDFKNSKKILAGNQDFSFSFQEYSKNQSGVINKVSKKDERLVSIFIENEEIINKTKITTFQDGKIILGGYDLVAKLIFSPVKDENKLELNPYGKPIIELKKTVDFIVAANSHKEFIVRPMIGGPDFKIPTVEIPIQKIFIDIIQALHRISMKFNRNMKFSPVDESDEFNSVLWLSAIIEDGLTIGNYLKITPGDKVVCDTFMKEICDKKNITFNYPEREINIMKTKFQLSKLLVIHCNLIVNVTNENGDILIEAEEIVLTTRSTNDE